MTLVTIIPKEVPINQVEIHPAILAFIPLKVLMQLLQSCLSDAALKSIAKLPVFITKKKGGRIHEKYIITHHLLTYLCVKRLQARGEQAALMAVKIDAIDETQVVDNFMLELAGIRRTQEAHAIIANIFQRVERSKREKTEPPLVNASLKDVLTKRSHTLRNFSGYDGRAFKNFTSTKDIDQDVKAFLEGFL